MKSILNPLCELESIFTLKKFPVKMISVYGGSKEDDIYEDMDFGCDKLGFVQLTKFVDLNVLYSGTHFPGSVGKLWKEHHENFAKFISQKSLNKVLEIGGSSGNLVRNIQEYNSWTIVDPIPITKLPNVNYIEDFFSDKIQGDYDTVVHSHLIEHIYDPIDFIGQISKILKTGKKHYIAFPNMFHWIKNGYVNSLFFEHPYYIDEYVLEYMLNINSFKIYRKEINNHSIMIEAVKVKEPIYKNIDFYYIKIIFEKYLNNLISDISKLKEQTEYKDIYLFGAHIFSQYLLYLGVKEENVINILDNDVNKQEKRLYGTNLIIKSPEVLRDKDSPIVILRAGVYSDEIREQLLTINSGTIIL